MRERVEMLVFDGAKLLDVAWPFEVSEGRRCAAYGDVVLTGRRQRNDVHWVRLAVDARADEAGPVDTPLVPGSDGFPVRSPSPEIW